MVFVMEGAGCDLPLAAAVALLLSSGVEADDDPPAAEVGAELIQVGE